MKREALKTAAHWHAQFCSGEATPADQLAWSAWRNAHVDHQWAWQQVELLQGKLQQHRSSLPVDIAANTFHIASASPLKQRRTVLKGFALVFLSSSAAWTTWRYSPEWMADYKTATGQQEKIVLADGSTLILNTNTAVTIVFSAEERLIRLQRGEIYIQTAADPAAVNGINRNFVVETTQGRVRALGTRFTVRLADTSTHVSVLGSAVEIKPSKSDTTRILYAGEQTNFSAYEIEKSERVTDNAEWRDGMLVATDYLLEDFIAELSRYRPGYLQCAPEVRHLRISGAFPLANTDLALKAMSEVLPVRIVQRTRYWVTVVPNT